MKDALLLTILAMVAMASPPRTSDAAGAPYSRTSPHWPHIRTMSADYRTQYISDAKQQRREREWLAAHLDHVILGPPAVYKALNPAIKTYNYALNMTSFQKGDDNPEESVTIAYTADMQRWFRQHPEYSVESAFLHDSNLCPAPQPMIAACRLASEWSGAKRWMPNPADSGFFAYQKDRFARLVDGGWDGVFVDENASGSMTGVACGKGSHAREFGADPAGCESYFSAVIRMLEAERAVVGPHRRIIINIAEYMSPYDVRMVVAAGGTQLEMVNVPNAETERRWAFIDDLLARGVFVNYAPASVDAFPQAYTKGGSVSASARWQLAMLANYYMVVPQSPENLTFTNQHGWKAPFPTWWATAQETDLGKPLGSRRIVQTGKDGAGQGYKIYIREFEGAYVIAHPKLVWSDNEFGDKSAVEVQLPGGRPLVPLFADGTRGVPTVRVALRNAESAILLKP